MANPYAGEVTIMVDGTPRIARLTLGALAELETALGEDTLVDLIERLEGGRVSSRDVFRLLVAGLRGGGWQITEADLISSDIAGGPVAAARLAAEMLSRAFDIVA